MVKFILSTAPTTHFLSSLNAVGKCLSSPSVTRASNTRDCMRFLSPKINYALLAEIICTMKLNMVITDTIMTKIVNLDKLPNFQMKYNTNIHYFKISARLLD